jgi:hypothetical protein
LSTFKLITTSRGSSIETENIWKALLLPLISNNFILMKLRFKSSYSVKMWFNCLYFAF